LPAVAKQVVFGPARYRDKKWDLLLMQLEHEGQMIDISGGDDARIFDDESQTWIEDPTDFNDIEWRAVFGLFVPVMAPRPLMRYKGLLSGKHQRSDIQAIQRCMVTGDVP
jgi:hypothetical protein